MKPFQIIIMLTLIGCSSKPNIESEEPRASQPVEKISKGLTFSEMTQDDEILLIDEMTGIDEFDFKPPIVKTADEPLLSDLQEIKTVRNEVMSQLNCDDLKIEYLGANDKKLMYKAVCDGTTYLVDYDLKSVQVVKVIKRQTK